MDTTKILTEILRPQRAKADTHQKWISLPDWMRFSSQNPGVFNVEAPTYSNLHLLVSQPEFKDAWKQVLDAVKLLETAPERAAARIIAEQQVKNP